METPFASPLYMVAKPVGATCNMACSYCYYTEKKRLFADGGKKQMDHATLETFIKNYLAAQTGNEAVFN
ncbi:MAG: anaerobic sulfatase maturase, partial [Muribaculaceae bacterium]|nr:anaerobic sulfatase maturase [Muribaculaceae bacterium]